MNKPNREQLRIITLLSLLFLSVVTLFLLKMEHDWRQNENLKNQLLIETSPQIENIHKKYIPYLKQLETQAEWKDGDLLLIYRIQLPDYLIDWFADIIDGSLIFTNPELVDELYTNFITELEYLAIYFENKIETDIDYKFTVQLISEQNIVLFWVDDSNVISSVIPDLSEGKNLGTIDYIEHNTVAPTVSAGIPFYNGEFSLFRN